MASLAGTYDGLLDEQEEFDEKSGDGSNEAFRGELAPDRHVDDPREGNGDDLVGSRIRGERRAPFPGIDSGENVGADVDAERAGFEMVIAGGMSESPVPCPPSLLSLLLLRLRMLPPDVALPRFFKNSCWRLLANALEAPIRADILLQLD